MMPTTRPLDGHRVAPFGEHERQVFSAATPRFDVTSSAGDSLWLAAYVKFAHFLRY